MAGLNYEQEKIVNANPCNSCFEATRSSLDLVKMLNRQWNACEHCAHKPVMRMLVEQFQKRRPLWWIVGGVSVVPPRVVEYFRRHPPAVREAG